MLIGKRISDRYKILEMIGGGGMANVYLAHDMILDRDVAVKILRLDFSNDEEFIRRFHREAQSATSLAHPNIVNIYDVGEEDSIYYIVMEYVDGQTLKQYIQKHSPVRLEEALEIMQQLTSAIAHAHQNHIIHRDIKPQNILIDHSGNVKITDFGIAMAMSATSITQTNSVLGSVHYLSPEQARGGMANRKSDIYSLGIVMFELLTGRLPFSGESAVSIALKHLQSETPSIRRWNPSIPQSVENIVLKATAKDPFIRYNSVEEMEDDLSTALDPSRMDEEKFYIPVDDDATKAIPIITNNRQYENLDETLVHDIDQDTGKPKKKESYENAKKKRKKWPVVLVSVFTVLVILAIATVTILPDLLAPKVEKVPVVTGLELGEAMDKLEASGFSIGEIRETVDEEIEEGLVIKTEPKDGKLIEVGTEIDIYQSLGKKKFELASYIGRNYDHVLQFLNKEDFKDIVKKEVFDDNEPAGTIIGQSFSSGEEVVPEETILEFTVSKGPQLISLIDLTGYNAKGLEGYTQSSGVIVEISPEEQYHDTIAEGLVISQEPKTGTKLKKGDKVTVVLSKGKEEKPPHTWTKEITIPYEPTVEGIPQVVQIFIGDMTRSLDEPYQTFEITSTVSRTLDFTTVPGESANYIVVRDNQKIMDESVSYPGE